jgi:hypothetical protein
LVFGPLKRCLLLAIVTLSSGLPGAFSLSSANAEEQATAYDISWPQCPDVLPQGDFSFAVIGLNGGRPFTANDCFTSQYEWAMTAEAHPDIYINLDFPRPGRAEAENGPYGICAADDDWCRGYNYGFALARDAFFRASLLGVVPHRYWFDVEMDNYWSDSPLNNSQVVRGALDSFDELGVAVGIYGTRYQWGLITGGYVPVIPRPLWVAGAESVGEAHARCHQPDFAFANGDIWLVQFLIGTFDENVACPSLAAAADGTVTYREIGRTPVVLETRVVSAEPVAEPAFRLAAIESPTPTFHESRKIVLR